MFRNILMMFMFAASVAQAAWGDYEETRDLSLDADGKRLLRIEAGAGSLEITGMSATGEIAVKAHIVVPGANAEEARAILSDYMVLGLEMDGDAAALTAYFEDNGGIFRNSPKIDLEVSVPDGMSLDVEDGSGSVQIQNVAGEIELDDGSGSIQMTDIGGAIKLKDGSGSISIEGAGQDVTIVDGSGSVTVARVEGSVRIGDGSGSIDVREVAGDLVIPDAGSGSVNFANIRGRVERAD